MRRIPYNLRKTAALLPNVALQPHQQPFAHPSGPLRKLLIHSPGSGKSLSAIAAAEALGEPYTAIAPASLRQNYLKEINKFTDNPSPDVMSYSALGAGLIPRHPNSLIMDETQELRGFDSARTQAAMDAADKAKQVMMLSATPIVNRPGELAVPLRMLTGEHMTPEEFEKRYVATKTNYPSLFHRIFGLSGKQQLDVNRPDELKSKLRGHVDYYDPGKPVVPTSYEDVNVEMGPEQTRIYNGIWGKLPWYIRYKLRHEIALSEDDLKKTMAFLTGPRQVGLSTMTFQRDPDPYKAYESSTKLQEAVRHMKEHLKDERAKGLVFANYISAGLEPYAAALAKEKVPHAIFHGGLSDAERKKVVDDYNTGKTRVVLLGPSGTAGLSFRGAGLTQLLDPHFQGVRSTQAIGRGLRFDSHVGLPEDLQNMRIQRYYSRLPHSFKGSILSRLGFDQTPETLATDDYLRRISDNKERLNSRFISLLKQIGSEGSRT